MYAIIATGGKQYKVAEGDVLNVEKLGVEAGEKVTFDNVLAVRDDNAMKVAADVAGASVEATVVENGKVFETLPLPIMGLMTDVHFAEVNEKLKVMKEKAYEMGVSEDFDPFITLSFMALTVIPELRVTPRGLYRVSDKGSNPIAILVASSLLIIVWRKNIDIPLVF